MSRYNEYIKSSGWIAKAQAAKQRAGQKCQLCGAKRKDVQLDTHHNTYQRLGREKNTDLLVLCEPCHTKHHDKLPKPDGEQLPLENTNGAVDAHDNTTPSQSLPLTPINTTSDAVESVVNAVTLPEWDTMTDDEKVDEAKRLCAAVEDKMGVMPPGIRIKVAERMELAASTYGKYRRGLEVVRGRKRSAYRYAREVFVHYLNTGEIKPAVLPELTPIQRRSGRRKTEKDAAAEKRLAEIEDRITALNAQRLTIDEGVIGVKWEQRTQGVRLNKAIKEGVRIDKRIDWVDQTVNGRCNDQDEDIIKLSHRLNGLAEANKHLLEKLEAATGPTPAAAPQVELAQWWERWWSR
jgi:hypothetical protein